MENLSPNQIVSSLSTRSEMFISQEFSKTELFTLAVVLGARHRLDMTKSALARSIKHFVNDHDPLNAHLSTMVPML